MRMSDSVILGWSQSFVCTPAHANQGQMWRPAVYLCDRLPLSYLDIHMFTHVDIKQNSGQADADFCQIVWGSEYCAMTGLSMRLSKESNRRTGGTAGRGNFLLITIS
jgi:hypothetical protein